MESGLIVRDRDEQEEGEKLNLSGNKVQDDISLEPAVSS